MINKVYIILFLAVLLSCTSSNRSEPNTVAEKEPQPINYKIDFQRAEGIRNSADYTKFIGYWFTSFNIKLDENRAILEKFKTQKILYINKFQEERYERGAPVLSELNVEKYKKIKYYLDSITSIYRNETPAFRSHPDDYVISITKNDSTYAFNLSFLNDTTTYRPIVYEFSDYLLKLKSKVDKDSL